MYCSPWGHKVLGTTEPDWATELNWTEPDLGPQTALRVGKRSHPGFPDPCGVWFTSSSSATRRISVFLKTWMCPCSAKMAFDPFLPLSLTHIQLPVSLPVAIVHSMLILLTSSPWHRQEQMQHPNKHCSAAPSPSEARPRAHTRVPGKLELGQARAGSLRLPLSLKDFTESIISGGFSFCQR